MKRNSSEENQDLGRKKRPVFRNRTEESSVQRTSRDTKESSKEASGNTPFRHKNRNESRQNEANSEPSRLQVNRRSEGKYIRKREDSEVSSNELKGENPANFSEQRRKLHRSSTENSSNENSRKSFSRDRSNFTPRRENQRTNSENNSEFTPRHERNERPRFERNERPRFERSNRNERTDRFERPERSERPKFEKAEKSENTERIERTEDKRPVRVLRTRDRSASEPTDGRVQRSPRVRMDDTQEGSSFDPRNKRRRLRVPEYNMERIQRKVESGPNDRKGAAERRRSQENSESGSDLIRLNRFIANSGICSRRDADKLILQGHITINNKVISELGYRVRKTDIVRFKGKVIQTEKPVYLVLNKPKDFITTVSDEKERKTVMDLVKNACPQRIYPVGRLDRNTTGVLLFTNDGELAKKLTHPSHQVQKIYKVELNKPIEQEHIDAIQNGVELEDGPAKVSGFAVLSPDGLQIGLEIHEGRNRIVRRIFESLGYEVVKLDRTVFAGMTKERLGRGDWRFLTENEVIRLKFFTGKAIM